MSPRRRIEPGSDGPVLQPPPKQPRQPGWWRLPLIAGVAAAVIAAAITVSALVLISHESNRRAAVRDVAVVGYVSSFLTQYTSLDPFHANDYTNRVLAQGTGDFAKQYKDKINEVAIQVARAEPTTGTVLDAGVQRWNDDGSAEVVVATTTTTTMPDGKTAENGNRWVATAVKEGDQWKISNLLQVI
jgi:Mce-associated membrane protein